MGRKHERSLNNNPKSDYNPSKKQIKKMTAATYEEE